MSSEVETSHTCCVHAFRTGQLRSLNCARDDKKRLALSHARRHNPGALHHQDHGPLRARAGDASRLSARRGLARREIDGAIFQVDEKPPADHVKELILVVVVMPVIFALHYAHTHDDCSSTLQSVWLNH